MVTYIPEQKKPTGVVIRTFNGDGSTTAFTIGTSLSVNKIIVNINGLTQIPSTDYTVIGTTLNINGGAPKASDIIEVKELPI
jgi:hypothetical protein